MPILFKLLIPLLSFIFNVKDLFPLIMITVIYGIAFVFIALPLMNNQKKTAEQLEYKGYLYLFSHFVLFLLTFGLWQLIWVYRTTKFVNEISADDKMGPASNVVLCLLVPFYTVYWNYKIAVKVDAYSKQNNIRSSISSSCLILTLFVDLASALLIQNKINEAVCVSVHIKKGAVINTEGLKGFQAKRYYNVEKHIALSLVTLGIWELVWIFRTTKALNEVEGEKYRGPVKKLLLCIFVPFYSVYWYYKTAKRVDEIALRFGIDSDIKNVSFVSRLIFGSLPVASVVLQGKINEIVNVEYGLNENFGALCDAYDIDVMVDMRQVAQIEHYNIFLYIILNIVTLGIWNFIWIWRVTDDLNAVTSMRRRSPALQMLLCLFVPVFYFCWIYKSARRVDIIARNCGVNSDISSQSVIYALYLSIMAPIIIQDKMNDIVESKSNHGTVDAAIVKNFAYRSMVLHIFMSMFFGPIWNLFWIYRTTKATNALKDNGVRGAGEQLLLCIFVPFYSYFWLYKTVQRIDNMSGVTGNKRSVSAACVILNVFGRTFASMIVQHKLNEIYKEVEAAEKESKQKELQSVEHMYC